MILGGSATHTDNTENVESSIMPRLHQLKCIKTLVMDDVHSWLTIGKWCTAVRVNKVSLWIMSRGHYSLVNLVPPDTIHRWIIFHLVNYVSPRVCVLRWFGIFVLHYNWKPHWQLVVTQAEQPSGTAPAFRMTNQNNGKIHKKNIFNNVQSEGNFFVSSVHKKRGA